MKSIRLSIDLYLPDDWDDSRSDAEAREWAVETVMDQLHCGMPTEAFDIEFLPEEA